jgi:hypothetical protein
MEKEFVPYELALRMKALGFDKPCMGYFLSDGMFIDTKISKQTGSAVSAPTWHTAFNWLRDVHGFMVHIEQGINPVNYYPVINNGSHKYNTEMWFDSYEEAELGCIKFLIDKLEKK